MSGHVPIFVVLKGTKHTQIKTFFMDIKELINHKGLEGLAHEILKAFEQDKPAKNITLQWRIDTLAKLLNSFKHLYKNPSLPSDNLKLGSETGSLINHMYSRGNLAPVIGMGATLLMWSDRRPYTIHKVSDNGKSIWVSADEYVRTDNNGYYTENQYYAYSNHNTSRPQVWIEYTCRKNGRWIKKGQPMNSTSLMVGRRMAYNDPSF